MIHEGLMQLSDWSSLYQKANLKTFPKVNSDSQIAIFVLLCALITGFHFAR